MQFHAICPKALEQREFESRAAAQAWVKAMNAQHPPGQCEKPAQVYTADEWEALQNDSG